MTSADLDLLCVHLSSLSADALYSLVERIGFELPKVRGRTLADAVSAIRIYLEGIAVLKRRLYCMAQIYCWLIPVGAIRPWKLYWSRHYKQPVNWVLLINYMRRRREEVCCTKKDWGAWHTSLLVAVEGRAYHELHCFSAWNTLPCVAIYEPPEGPTALLRCALRETLWEALDNGGSHAHQYPGSAHAAALRLLRERLGASSMVDTSTFTPPTNDHTRMREK